MTWTSADIPSQTGKIFVITGANAGIGRETARALARNGAEVVMAVRNVSKGKKAANEIRAEKPDAILHVMALDLSKLDSVREFASAFLAKFDRLDVLINNAGLYDNDGGNATTADGFALMMGVNHLGHFALTGLLLERVLNTPNSRVVTLSSGIYTRGKIDLETFHTPAAAVSGAYGDSKLANMLFMLELQRRLAIHQADTISVAVGPGPTKSDGAQEGIRSIANPFLRRLADRLTNLIMADSADGALPSLRAATDPEAQGGDYFVPGGFMNMFGHPKAIKPGKEADPELAQQLWERSADLTGINYKTLQPGT